MKENINKKPVGKFDLNKTVLSLIIIISLVVCSLIFSAYLSFRSLRQDSLNSFAQNLEERAVLLDYFIEERVRTIKSIAEGVAISQYFENKDLGMSMKYGLGIVLENLKTDFTNFIKQRKLDGAPIYKRISFFDVSGKLLVDEVDTHILKSDINLPNVIDRKSREAYICAGSGEHNSGFYICNPYYHKNKYAGHIILALSCNTLDKKIVIRESRPRKGSSEL